MEKEFYNNREKISHNVQGFAQVEIRIPVCPNRQPNVE